MLNYGSRNHPKCVGWNTWSQNLSKIELGGDLEATWKPPLCRGDPKTSFLPIWAPLWDPIWGSVLAHVGVRFLIFLWDVFWMAVLSIWGHFGSIVGVFVGTFLEARLNLHIKHDMHENICIYCGLAMSEPLENWLCWRLWGSFWDAFKGSCFGRASGPHFDDFGSLLGFLLDTILVTFGVPFLDRFSEGFQDSRAGLELRGFGG